MEILEINKDELTQFLIKTKNNNVFLSKNFTEQFSQIIPYGVFSKDKQLKGVFILQQFKRLKLFKQISNPSFTPNCQLIYKIEAQNKAKKNSEEKKVIHAITDFLDKRKEQVVSISFPENWIDFQPFYWKKFKVITNYTYQISLSKSKEELFDSMSTERRKNITKAQKDGIVIKQEKPTKETLAIILNTFNKNGKLIDKEALQTIVFNVANELNSLFLVAYNKEENPIAVNFCLLNNKKALYMFGGYDFANKHEGAGSLAMWHAILYAKENGFGIFDLEGSMVPKIEKYFRGFGGELIPYYRVNKSSFVIESILKIKDKANF